jgi:type III pantothenate kinase
MKKVTVDIGNSVIGIAFFKDDVLFDIIKLTTDETRTKDLYKADLNLLLKERPALKEDVKYAIISSVVPRLTPVFARLITEMFDITPLVIAPGVKTGLSLKIDNPRELGSDLVAVSVGALSHYKAPLIVVDLGTANKFLYLDENSRLAGAVFTPGLVISLNALINNAAQLSNVAIEKPKFILGRNTTDCINSGVIYGNIAMINELVNMIEKETNQTLVKVLTGGNSHYVCKELCNNGFHYEENLIHDGLLIILNKNIKEKENA